MPERPWLSVNWDRNMMGGPRRFWPNYANILGLIGSGFLLVVAFLLLALLLSPWFWIGFAVSLIYGVILAVWWGRARGFR